MTASVSQLDEVAAAARWLTARQAEALPGGFNLQNVTVQIADPDAPADPTRAARVELTWQGDHYTFTVA